MTDFRARVRHGDVSRSLAAAATRSHPTCGHVAGAAKELDTSPWHTRAMKTQKSSTVIRRTQVLSVCAGCTPAACLRARTRATVGITKLYELRGRVVRASGRPPRSNCGMRAKKSGLRALSDFGMRLKLRSIRDQTCGGLHACHNACTLSSGYLTQWHAKVLPLCSPTLSLS